MSEEKLKRLYKLLHEAMELGSEQEEKKAKLGDFILDEAMWGGFIVKNTDDGSDIRVEV